MRNIYLTIRYNGSRYHGFQVQKNALGVCTVFQDAVEKVLGTRYDVKGCSRTDAGVHALKYGLSMKIGHTIPCERLVHALNAALPDDIAVTDAREAPPDFHARYHCKGKEYVYKILNSRIKDPFSPYLSYRLGYNLDADMLCGEARDFVGTHDFSAFCSAGSDVEDRVRTVWSFTVARRGEKVLFTVRGDGFLYNMVRIMVGTLVYIAMGRIAPGAIPDIIASKDRMRAGKTMPAHGLYLNDVFYDMERTEWEKP
ncbi:MAG: tRNA pseudouridine(38-40) synthase TruA [Oscillospiraceae bacterium]|jgi:tRNA pseudouridine38-40 synthase|nr:tRNA pseudouridine(38-40) synthase TruA [Oscillospiraceae bacterium]